MNKPTYKIKCLETNAVLVWTATQVLEEINRDRNPEWQDYDLNDDIDEAWNFWIEGGEYYSMVIE